MQHLWNSFGDYRKRVNQSWLRQEAVLDQTQGLEMKPETVDDMGDIIIKGDESHEHTHHHGKQCSAGSELLKYLLALLLGAGVAWYFLNQPTPTITERPDVDWTLDLEVRDEP